MSADPGGQWTREDLPRRSLLRHRYLCAKGSIDERMDQVALEVIEHLEKFHRKPVPYDRGGILAPSAAQTVANMEARAITAEYARDAAVARAEQAEQERDEWRKHVEANNPIVYRIRESDITAVKVKRNEKRDWWTRNRGYGKWATADGMRQVTRMFVKDAVDCEAIARAIEAEQAVDPVEAKAEEVYEVSRNGDDPPYRLATSNTQEKSRRIARHLLWSEGKL